MSQNTDQNLLPQPTDIKNDEQNVQQYENIQGSNEQISNMIQQSQQPQQPQQHQQQPKQQNNQMYFGGEQQQYVCQQQFQLPIQRTKSIRNKQYEMKNLLQIIQKQTKQLNQQMQLGFDWTMILYQSCGWRRQLFNQLCFTPEQKHKKLIHYTDKFIKLQGESKEDGDCGVCGEQKIKLLKNICGHQFCGNCWSDHLQYRLKQSYKDPFPPCIVGSGDCDIRMSYTQNQLLSNKNKEIRQKFKQVLCRSYATHNKFVKMCKGRPGITCNKCFTIQKMLDIIQCQTCGNFVCPRCGQMAHGPSQCFQIRNWKQLTQNSTQFIQFLNYKPCPNCKQIIQRSQGCNSVICKCKQQFCFVCGQKWLPNHSTHGDSTCYRFKEIQALNQQKKKMKQNRQQFYYKVQDRKAKLDSYIKRFQRVSKFKHIQLQQINKLFKKQFPFYGQLKVLKQFCTFLQRSLCILWGQTLSFHFKQDKQGQYLCQTIQKNISRIQDMLFNCVQAKYILFTKDQNLLIAKQRDQLQHDKQNRKQFVDIFTNKVKDIQLIIVVTKKMVESF